MGGNRHTQRRNGGNHPTEQVCPVHRHETLPGRLCTAFLILIAAYHIDSADRSQAH